MSAELARVDRELRAFVKERPVLALLSAVAAGYVSGACCAGACEEASDADQQSATEIGSSESNRRAQRVRHEVSGLTAEVEGALGDLERVVREQLERRPYATLAAASGLGYVLGGGVPVALSRMLFGMGGRLAFVMMAQRLARRPRPAAATTRNRRRSDDHAESFREGSHRRVLGREGGGARRDADARQVLRALGGKPADDDMMSSFGIFAAGIVLGAGLAVLFAPRPGSEIREAIGEKISNLRPAADADA